MMGALPRGADVPKGTLAAYLLFLALAHRAAGGSAVAEPSVPDASACDAARDGEVLE